MFPPCPPVPFPSRAPDALFVAKIHFDWDAPRSREGYFKLRGGVDYCIAR